MCVHCLMRNDSLFLKKYPSKLGSVAQYAAMFDNAPYEHPYKPVQSVDDRRARNVWLDDAWMRNLTINGSWKRELSATRPDWPRNLLNVRDSATRVVYDI